MQGYSQIFNTFRIYGHGGFSLSMIDGIGHFECPFKLIKGVKAIGMSVGSMKGLT